jgi:hypothetical protein
MLGSCWINWVNCREASGNRAEQQKQHKREKQHEHQNGPQQPGQPQPAPQKLDDAFQQISDDDARQHRSQIAPHEQDHAGAQHQHDGQNDRLGIVEKPSETSR